jgi:transcriptional regulator with XRE-family HTH domain
MNIIDRKQWGKAFGRVLKRQRTARKLTHDELTTRAGIDNSYCWYLETGRRHPTLHVIVSIACALGMQPDELLRAVMVEVKKPARAA